MKFFQKFIFAIQISLYKVSIEKDNRVISFYTLLHSQMQCSALALFQKKKSVLHLGCCYFPLNRLVEIAAKFEVFSLKFSPVYCAVQAEF